MGLSWPELSVNLKRRLALVYNLLSRPARTSLLSCCLHQLTTHQTCFCFCRELAGLTHSILLFFIVRLVSQDLLQHPKSQDSQLHHIVLAGLSYISRSRKKQYGKFNSFLLYLPFLCYLDLWYTYVHLFRLYVCT